MKIAFVVSTNLSLSPFNGILIQAESWASALEAKGHTVIRVNPWEQQEWEKYDIIHIVGKSKELCNLTDALVKRNPNIVFSPIIDTLESISKYKFATYWGSQKLRLESENYIVKQACKNIKHFCVRSRYELSYVNRAYSIPENQISIIPLSYRLPVCDDYPVKGSFCMHISKLTDGRKNVDRLIKAAIKYKFKLVLAGSISSENDFAPMKKLIDANANITYLGRIDDDTLIQLYKKAKVFALPSINEGVGMVALDAALYGCEIVVTKLGGPSEYYNGMAIQVNPYSVDDIGQAIVKAMYHSDFQPELQKYIRQNFDLSVCVDKLITAYESVIFF